MKVHGFFYNGCIHESVPGLMGLYVNRKDAEIAMEFHKECKRNEYQEYMSIYDKKYGSTDIRADFGIYESWNVEAIEVIE